MKRMADHCAMALTTGMVLGLAGAASAQEAVPGEDGVVETRVGTIVRLLDEGGDPRYALDDGVEDVGLSIGPSWFWREDHPIADLVGKDDA